VGPTLQAAAADKGDAALAAAAKAEIEKLVALKAEVGAAESGCAPIPPRYSNTQMTPNDKLNSRQAHGNSVLHLCLHASDASAMHSAQSIHCNAIAEASWTQDPETS
jgi:hypothetical protein